MTNVVDRFIKYIKIDTQSDEASESCPSSKKQWDLANLLVEELKSIGLVDANIDEKGYIMATLPSNLDKEVPKIGFIAHYDTSPDMSGTNVKPRFIENYDGSEIVLNKENDVILSPKDFPELNKYIGQTLITTDGTTLLGADDKAGIAEIITAVDYLCKNPQIKHGTIKVGFTPDEEIGRGADFFNVEKFGADFGYTMDGGEIGELEYENFNAAMAKLTFQGRNVHPGYAKDKMVSAMHMAMEFNSLLPVNERPEFTTSYEGFYHLIGFQGAVEESTIQYIIRDHDRQKFEQKKVFIQKAVDFMNKKYDGRVKIELKDQYFNMREKIEEVMHIIDTAVEAMELVGVKPKVMPIRGGTDGARLSFMGLPCPNIFAGGHNFHGKYEFVPVNSMEKAVEVILKIVELNANK
jgi:tripeptide aminopeptidase